MPSQLLGNTLELLDMLADIMEYLSKTDIGAAVFDDFLVDYPKHRELFNMLVAEGEKKDDGW